MLKANKELFQQKSKENWLKKGNQNSAFYFSNIAQRNYNTTIKILQDRNGNIVRDTNNIGEILVHHFTNFLGTGT